MFGRCALRLRQCIPFARKCGVLSRRSAAGSGSLVARHRQVHAPCEAETGNGHKCRSAKQADRHGALGYKGARRKRLGGWSILNPTTESVGSQAFGHMADHRCTKDAAEERAGPFEAPLEARGKQGKLKPGLYKGTQGAA